MKRAMRRKKTWQRQAAAITAAMMAMSVGGIAYAMPQGEVIRSGKGEITRQDKDMTVNQDSKRLAIDWSGFDIANDERVTFRQPDKDSVALNRVVGDAASVIDGTLSGNGHVYVINPNGVLFGKNASVDVGSLVASTARISDRDMTNFANADGITMAIPEDSSAKVINAGTIRAEGGLVVLHAAEVENSGTITTPEGTTALAAARNLSLSADTAGKINFTVDGALAKAKALNSGMLKADGGYLVMTARSAGDVMSTVVNNTGTMEAKTLRQNEKGEILLDGGDNGIVELNGTLDASGMEAGQSAGSIKAIGAETHVEDGATLHAIGAVDGGLIETSGDYLEIGDNVDIDAAGKTGKAGEWLLDPLDVVISASQPSGSTNAASDDSYNEVQTADANKTSWVNSKTVNALLSSGTSVKIQSVDKNKAATITVDSEIKKSGAENRDTTFTLEAQSNVTVNKSITSTAGKLNVVLNSDIDGNGVGAVLINADIDTNGGSFTSGSGGNVELKTGWNQWYGYYTYVDGTADPTQGTVGTYFGNGGSTVGRTINTNGGEVNLYGDVAIGLNGGNLTLDTNGGSVNVIGSIDSGNAYTIYSMDDTEKWDELVSNIKSSYSDDTWDSKARSYYESISPRNKVAQSGEGYTYYRNGTLQYYTVDWQNLSSAAREKVARYYVANNWDFAKILAQGRTEGGAKTGDTYLATITTALENSLTSQGKENPLFVGGRGSGNPDRPIDSTYRNGYYWVTGPEGLVTNANGIKGTKFAENDGTPTENYYANWNNGKSDITGETTKEPNNSGPYVSVGFGLASNWDDVKSSAGTTKGFVQEKNLAHSGLVINSNGGSVDLKGNVGHSVALSNLDITNAGTVNIGGGTNQSGAALSGIVNVDNNVDITGNGVTVGDRITADEGHVNVTSDGNILVHGITAGDKIKLVSKGESGDITIDDYGTTNNGALITKSTENDAVIIDARGANGSFHNATDATKAKNAITTGTGGNWKVYSASPDRDDFGKNLDSETTARWHASSQRGSGLYTYAETENTNKYIFQVQPTITVKADDQTKTYGDLADVSKYTTTATAYFEGRNGRHSVSEEKYTHAFHEDNLKDRYTGEITLSSEGAAAEKTRMDGDINKTSSDNARPYFFIRAEGHNLAGKEGYDVTTEDGTLTILKRDANINGTGTQTYGTSDISWTTTASNLKNNDQVGTVTIKEGSDYTKKQQGRTTADAGTYENSAAFGSILNEKGEDASINYNLTGTGTIEVNPATLKVTRKGYTTEYGTVLLEDAAHPFTTWGKLVNDDVDDIKVDNKDYGGAYLDGNTRTNNASDTPYTFKEALTSASNVLRNYTLDDTQSNSVTITPYTITSDDIVNGNPTFETVYGNKDKKLDVVINGVNGDGEIANTSTTTAYIYDEATGKPSKTNNVGNDYSITTVLNNTNYRFDNGTNTKLFEKSAKVTPATLKVNRTGYTTEYGTVILEDAAHPFTTWDPLVNGDVDDIKVDNKNYGGAYLDNNTRTNNASDTPYMFKEDLTSDSNVLCNYKLDDTQSNSVTITPYTITSDDIVNGNPTFETIYGNKDKKLDVVKIGRASCRERV